MIVEIITCDNCGSNIETVQKPIDIRGRQRDFCSNCLSIVISGTFTFAGPSQRLEARQLAELNNLRKYRDAAERSFASIRALLPRAIEEWTEGKDPRDTITKAEARAAVMV